MPESVALLKRGKEGTGQDRLRHGKCRGL